MTEFDKLFGDEFFLIDSNNLNSIKQSFYGYCITKNGVFLKEDINSLANLDGNGAYIFIEVDENNIIISQDYMGSYGTYIYQDKGYFSISNSFIKLVEYLKDFKNITFNKKYADAFMFAPLVSIANDKTLVNEIKLIPRDCKIIINKASNKIDFEYLDFEEQTVPIDSEKGIELLDEWYSKWANVLRLLKSKNNPIEMDLSGGFDSRTVAAIWLSSNIDLNNVRINSHKDQIHLEDYEIASEIAREFNFELNNYSIRPDIVDFKELDTSLNLSFYTKLGFHKEMYFKQGRYSRPHFIFSGSGGETVRGYYNSTPQEYSKKIINNIKNYSEELVESSQEILDYSLNCVREKYDLDKDSYIIPEKMYIENNNRHHFGKDLVENYLSNAIKLAPLMDWNLQKLIIETDTCKDRDLLIALIFQRYCPKLLDFKFEGNRDINKDTLIQAKQISDKYPRRDNFNKFISNQFIKQQNAKIKGIKVEDVSDYLEHIFNTRLFEMEFKKYYSDDIYNTIREYSLNKQYARPLRHVFAAVAILKIIHATNYKNISFDADIDEWLKSFYNGENIGRIPFLFPKSMLKYNTARIDLKNFGFEDNSLEILFNSDSKSKTQFPDWFKTEQGEGLVISSNENSLDLKIKCIKEGEIKIWLRGLDVRDKNNKRIPIYINYTKFIVNGESYFTDNHLIWHDTPYLFKKHVADSEIMDIHIEWTPF